MIKNVLKKIAAVFEVSARARVARELLALSDKQLMDLGFSRAKLRQGVSAHPWKMDAPVFITSVAPAKAMADTVDYPQENIAA